MDVDKDEDVDVEKLTILLRNLSLEDQQSQKGKYLMSIREFMNISRKDPLLHPHYQMISAIFIGKVYPIVQHLPDDLFANKENAAFQIATYFIECRHCQDHPTEDTSHMLGGNLVPSGVTRNNVLLGGNLVPSGVTRNNVLLQLGGNLVPSGVTRNNVLPGGNLVPSGVTRNNVLSQYFNEEERLSLSPGQYVVNTVIDYFLSMLSSINPTIFSLPCVKIGGDEIVDEIVDAELVANFHLIFQPVWHANHYFLIVAMLAEKKVAVLDSMKYETRQKLAFDWWQFQMSMKKRNKCVGRHEEKWTKIDIACSPQKDKCSCGIFTMMNALAISINFPPSAFCQCHVEEFRKLLHEMQRVAGWTS